MEFQTILNDLQKDANAKYVLLVGKDRQVLAAAPQHEYAAGDIFRNVAESGGAGEAIAKLLEQQEFSFFPEAGEGNKIHFSRIGQRAVLAVLFDDNSSLGLVRLRVKRSSNELETALDENPEPLPELTDDEVYALFQG